MGRPTIEDRLRHRERPSGRAAMYQSWRQLLFLHWSFSPAAIQATLPKGLTVDTYEGQAWVGVVPFWMREIRPWWLPAIPGLSNFLELNLRTYVHDEQGNSGVWFYSLDADLRPAIWTARRFFHLNYQRSAMTSARDEATGQVKYASQRFPLGDSAVATFRYRPTSVATEAQPGTLEFFLVERYLLFSCAPHGQLWTGQVNHPPYPIQAVAVDEWSEIHFELNGLTRPNRPPEHATMSQGVDVEVFGLRASS